MNGAAHRAHDTARGLRRLRWFGAALLLSALPLPLHAQDRPLEEGFFDLLLPATGRRTGVSVLVDTTGRVLIPLRSVLDQTGIASSWSPDSVVLEWPVDLWRTVLRYADRTIESGGTVRRVPDAEWARSGPELFLSADVLASVLGSAVDVAFADLVIILQPNPDFPVLRRAGVDRRRRLERPFGEGPAPDSDIPYPPRNGGFVGSWGLSVSEAQASRRAAFRAAAGASAWGGALELGGTLGFGNTIPTTLRDRFLRWTRGFPDDPWIRRLEAGTIFSEGPAGRRLFGFGLTNAPLTAPRLFGEAVIQPAVPAGWEYEVYQGDYLVGVGSRAATDGIRTPLNYGNTPVTVRLVGPSGQELIQNLVYVVRPGMVPAHHLRYGLGAGACADPGCDDYAWAELRYGFLPILTAGMGIDRLTLDRSGTAYRPYFMAAGNPLPNVGAELQLQPGALFRSAIQVQTGAASTASASYAWIEPPGDEPVLAGWNAQLSWSAPVPAFGGRFVTARALLRGVERDRVNLWQIGLATTLRRIHTALEYETGLQARDLLTARAFLTWPAARGPFRDVSISGAIGISRLGPDLFEASFSARPMTAATLSAGLRVRRDARPALILGFATRTGVGFAQLRASRASEGSTLFMSADGGLARDPEVGTMLLPFESLGRAGLAGTVFDDLDGDGQLSPGEPPLPNALVNIGTARIATRSDGTFRTWLLEPYEALPVALDSLSIPFDRVPAHRVVLVRPSPNLFTRIDIPVLRTREIIGSITGTAPLPLGGIGVEILDLQDRIIATTRTFRDGEYYLPRVRPGTYRIRPAPASLAALGVAADPAFIEILVPAHGSDIIRAPAILIR